MRRSSRFSKKTDRYHPKLNAAVFKRLGEEYRILFRAIYCCGLRVSEVRKLKHDDVDLEKGAIRIRQKVGKPGLFI
ncbi:tyrosine-type recombinase/integrase [Robinsoniella peoriensis]|uniref:tyrosine-type recombinase/integrase n=1 Tax=Robinsoniella peoriensis TaxID=180332 RepID=UPI00362D450B